jgi:hypothetical protein
MRCGVLEARDVQGELCLKVTGAVCVAVKQKRRILLMRILVRHRWYIYSRLCGGLPRYRSGRMRGWGEGDGGLTVYMSANSEQSEERRNEQNFDHTASDVSAFLHMRRGTKLKPS